VLSGLGRRQLAVRLWVARAALVLDGEDVMRRLGVGPGSHVGRALNFLALRVADDPACNRRDVLLALLDDFAASERAGSGEVT
jgi:hypothetical protein